jgi:hypothetical protein
MKSFKIPAPIKVVTGVAGALVLGLVAIAATELLQSVHLATSKSEV